MTIYNIWLCTVCTVRKKKCHAISAFQALMGMKRKAAIFLIFAALFCVSKDGMGLVFQNARWYNITIYTVSKDIYFRFYMVKI